MDNMPQHSRPFDLDKALAGHPLITRGGCAVSDFERARGPLCSPAFPFSARIDVPSWGWRLATYTIRGRHHVNLTSTLDLFLANNA
jgi:hypothetical protein